MNKIINTDAVQLGRCKRCNRIIKIRTPGQEYGRVCARRMAGQISLESQALVSGIVLKVRNHE